MEPVRKWSIFVSVGLLIVLVGLYLASAGTESGQDFSQDWTVDRNYVYYVRMDAAGGKPIDSDYSLSSGTMTVAMVSGEGFRQLTEELYLNASEVFLSQSGRTSGSVSWTPDADGRYYLVFYDFSLDGAALTASGSFTGSSPTFFYGGIVVIVVGAVIAGVGAWQVKKAKGARERLLPQDVKVFEQQNPPPPPPQA